MSKQILIVDDNPWNAQLVADVLVHRDYDVVTAQRGDLALEMVANGLPDLVLLDIMLPDMNGLDIARTLRISADKERLPIVAVTALGNLNVRNECIEAGCDEVIIKPVTNREIVKCVSRYLET